MTTKYFIGTLKEVRVHLGMSQRELARVANVPNSTISRIEKGVMPSIPTTLRICKAIDGGVEILVDRDDVLFYTRQKPAQETVMLSVKKEEVKDSCSKEEE